MERIAAIPYGDVPRAPTYESIVNPVNIPPDIMSGVRNARSFYIPERYWTRFIPEGRRLPSVRFENLREQYNASVTLSLRAALEYGEGTGGWVRRTSEALSAKNGGMRALQEAVEQEMAAVADQAATRAANAPGVAHILYDQGANHPPVGVWYGQNGHPIGVGTVPPPGAVGVGIPQPAQNEPDGW
jgi:hypothetical protein